MKPNLKYVNKNRGRPSTIDFDDLEKAKAGLRSIGARLGEATVTGILPEWSSWEDSIIRLLMAYDWNYEEFSNGVERQHKTDSLYLATWSMARTLKSLQRQSAAETKRILFGAVDLIGQSLGWNHKQQQIALVRFSTERKKIFAQRLKTDFVEMSIEILRGLPPCLGDKKLTAKLNPVKFRRWLKQQKQHSIVQVGGIRASIMENLNAIIALEPSDDVISKYLEHRRRQQSSTLKKKD